MKKAEVKKQLNNKAIVTKGEKILEGKNEIAIIVLKPGKKISFDLHSIEKDVVKAKKTQEKLKTKGYMSRLCLKSIGDKHKAVYLSDFGDCVCLSYGINRTLELNIRQLRDKLGTVTLKRKLSKEKSGYMGFAFHHPSSSYVCTRLYDTQEEALHFISKRYGVDLDSIEIIDLSRLINGSFRFSNKKYEEYNRLKQVKKHKLIEKFGHKEAMAILKSLEEQRAEIEASRQRAKELIKETEINTETVKIIEDPKIEMNYQYLEKLLDIIKDIQLDTLNSSKEILELEKTSDERYINLLNSKKYSNSANNNSLKAQEIIEKVLDGIKTSM